MSTAIGLVVLPIAFAYFVARALNWPPWLDFWHEHWLVPTMVIATALMAFFLPWVLGSFGEREQHDPQPDSKFASGGDSGLTQSFLD